MLGQGVATAQRFEYKYLIAERQAEIVRGFALSHLRADSHTDAAHNNEYPVYSLYLDSGDMGLYYSTVTGEKNRFKLRVRCYDGRPDTPAFVEIKARKNDTIQKRRAPVRKEALGRILGSFCMSSDDLTEPAADDIGALGRFCELCAKLSAQPKVIVHYMREAYVDPEGRPLRLTMDRHLACVRTNDTRLALDGPGWIEMSGRWLVLEIKFTDTFPDWTREMVRSLDLVRTSAAKYVRSIDTLIGAGLGLA